MMNSPLPEVPAPRAPLVSVIIPTKDRVCLLEETLESVRRQTYSNWEALVVDDGSTDDTLAWVAAMAKQDSRIQGLRRYGGQAGASFCRNEGVAASRGEYLLFLDSDDLLAPACLQDRVTILEHEVDLDFVVFQSEAFETMPGDAKVLYNVYSEENDIDRFLRRDVVWQTAGAMWRRSAVQKVGDWDGALLSWQDWDYHLRAMVLGCHYNKFPARDCYWRLPPHQGETIGLRSRSPAHLRNQEYLFRKTTVLFSQKQLLSKARKNLIAGNYLHVARLWEESHHSLADALRVWRLCYVEGLVNYASYLKVKVYFLLARWSGGWRVRPGFRAKLGKWYPSLLGSQTMSCVPIGGEA